MSTDAPTLIKCHLNAFQYFGGYPQEILYDNMKLEKEQESLLDLSRPAYRVVVEEGRRIGRESFVSYRSNRYSVPFKYAGLDSKIRLVEDELQILVNGVVVANHLLLDGSSRTSRDKEHFKGLLSLVMKEETGKKKPLGVLRFDQVVEKRSLSVYDALGGGDTVE